MSESSLKEKRGERFGIEVGMAFVQETNSTHRDVKLFCNARADVHVRAQFQIPAR